MPISVEVTGIEQLQAKLNRLADVGATLKTPFVQAASDVRTYMKEYPPETEANRPSAEHPWYQRGYGPRWIRKRDGMLRGRKTSQMLSNSWTMHTRFTKASAEAVIGTRVSYARFVHSADRQPAFHKRRNWRTVQAAVKHFGPQIVRRIEAAINAALNK